MIKFSIEVSEEKIEKMSNIDNLEEMSGREVLSKIMSIVAVKLLTSLTDESAENMEFCVNLDDADKKQAEILEDAIGDIAVCFMKNKGEHLASLERKGKQDNTSAS